MSFALYGPAVLVAFVITLLEMTEVVILVFALSADQSTIARGAWGAVGGTATVALIALGFGALLIAFPRQYLLWASAALLVGFGAYMFRGTLRSFRRARAAAQGTPSAPPKGRGAVQFAGGFTVGAIEATEAVVVLLAIAAAGYAPSAIVGAVAAGAILVAATAVVHDQIRRIKVPWLRLGATSMLFTFAVFWAGEAAGVAWPGSDLFLIPLFLLSLLLVRGVVGLGLRHVSMPSPAG